jgi:hypothetical protein
MHKEQGGKIYLIRGNWASEKGFIDGSEAKFTDHQPLPFNDGCFCSYRYLSHLSDLPAELLTPKGKDALADEKRRIEQILNTPASNPRSLGGFAQSIKNYFK